MIGLFVVGYLSNHETEDSSDLSTESSYTSKGDSDTEKLVSGKVTEKAIIDWRDIEMGIISPYPRSVGTSLGSTTYPLSPKDEYIKYIDSAKEGNNHAQYRLARTIKDCRGYKTQKQISDMEYSGKYPEYILQNAKALNSRCVGLAEIMEQESLADWDVHYTWLVKSAESHDIGKAWLLTLHPDQLAVAESREIIYKALASDHNDDFFALNLVGPYLGSKDADVQLHGAWQVALCNLQSFCDDSVMEAYIQYNERQSGYDWIMENASKIENAFKTKNYEILEEFLP